MCTSGKSVSPLCPSPWCHSPTASLPIKALIKTDKVSPNEERAVGGLNCWSLSITPPEESGEGRARGYSNDMQSRGHEYKISHSMLYDSSRSPRKMNNVWGGILLREQRSWLLGCCLVPSTPSLQFFSLLLFLGLTWKLKKNHNRKLANKC